MTNKEAVEFIKEFIDPKKTETSFEELLKAREAEEVLIRAIDECVKKCSDNSKLENSKLETSPINDIH